MAFTKINAVDKKKEGACYTGCTMDYKKSIGLGVVCWAIMLVAMFLFVALKQDDSLVFQLLAAVIGGVATYWLAGFLKPATTGTALGYGVIFVIVGVILDLIITEQFMPGILGMWPVWFGYVLVLLAPLLQVKKA